MKTNILCNLNKTNYRFIQTCGKVKLIRGFSEKGKHSTFFILD